MTESPVKPAFSPPFKAANDWLEANGVSEWIPENPTISVVGDQLTYTAFRFEGDRRGFDTKAIVVIGLDVATEDRTVPLRLPLTDVVREAFRQCGATIEER